jgi:hypothetical protein
MDSKSIQCGFESHRGHFPLIVVGGHRDDSSVHPRRLVDEARRLYAMGRTATDVARSMGLPRATVAHWCRGDRRPPDVERSACPRCTDSPLDVAQYAYLLGQYLGDGHITTGRRDVHCLSIFCADTWPGVRAEVESALGAVLPVSKVSSVQRIGCAQIKSYSKHWTCLFPQHGPGRKHTRTIALEDWQREIVDDHPGPFLRGLIHSDGCRMTNWTQRRVAGELKRYEYPRYFFTNKSLDILALCCTALDRLGIAHRRPYWDQVSVARREAVAALDVWVGPKT